MNRSSYAETLRELAEQHSQEEIQAMFKNGPNFQGRTLIIADSREE